MARFIFILALSASWLQEAWGAPQFLKNLLLPKPAESRFNSPSDLIELIPIVRDINRMIPRNFSLASHHFELKSLNCLVIEKKLESIRRRRTRKNSVIAFTYAGPSRLCNVDLNVPLLYSEGFFGWESYPLGNYRLTLDRGGALEGETFRLTAQTRF